MEIQNLIDDKNKNIYNFILENNYNIKLVKSPNDRLWGVIPSGPNEFSIYYLENTENPQAAFAHEILHTYIQIKGYKRILGGINLESIKTSEFRDYLINFDNEIQHWKMYPAFISMNYEYKYFFADSDQYEFKKSIENILKLANEVEPSLIIKTDLALRFLTVIIPIGFLRKSERKSYEQRFLDLNNYSYREMFLNIKKIITSWSSSSSYNSIEVMIQLLKIIGFSKAWITQNELNGDLDQEILDTKGTFVGHAFSIETVKSKIII